MKNGDDGVDESILVKDGNDGVDESRHILSELRGEAVLVEYLYLSAPVDEKRYLHSDSILDSGCVWHDTVDQYCLDFAETMSSVEFD